MSGKRIVFCGVGALGSSALTLCRNVPADLVAIDFDRVESKNLLAQAFVKPSVGKNKAEAMKLQMQNFWSVKIESFGVRVGPENVEALLAKADLVVDCFDNQKSREVLSTFARARGIALVHAAISGDGTFGIVRWDERFTPDAEDHAGQATCEGGEHLPLIGLVGAALARTVQDWEKTGERRDSMIALRSVTATA
jgi:molybdopterin/thiamine biosynthesis adenylyltransferase